MIYADVCQCTDQWSSLIKQHDSSCLASLWVPLLVVMLSLIVANVPVYTNLLCSARVWCSRLFGSCLRNMSLSSHHEEGLVILWWWVSKILRAPSFEPMYPILSTWRTHWFICSQYFLGHSVTLWSQIYLEHDPEANKGPRLFNQT